jgi:hypothetical protein
MKGMMKEWFELLKLKGKGKEEDKRIESIKMELDGINGMLVF